MRTTPFQTLTAALLFGLLSQNPVHARDLLVSSPGNNSIQRYDAETGRHLGIFTQVDDPQGLAIGPDGALYCASGRTNSIYRFTWGVSAVDPQGLIVASGRPLVANGIGGLRAPLDIAFGPDGNLYVVSSGTGQILKYDPEDGRFLGVYATVPPNVPGGRSVPFGLQFLQNGELLVAVGIYGDRIERFDAQGAYAGPWCGQQAMGMDNPTDLALANDGRLYIASNSYSNRPPGVILATGPNLDGLRVFAPTGASGLRNPWGIAVDGKNRVYCIDGAAGQVLRFDEAGAGTVLISAGQALKDPTYCAISPPVLIAGRTVTPMSLRLPATRFMGNNQVTVRIQSLVDEDSKAIDLQTLNTQSLRLNGARPQAVRWVAGGNRGWQAVFRTEDIQDLSRRTTGTSYELLLTGQTRTREKIEGRATIRLIPVPPPHRTTGYPR